jgi:hypothetical protein
MNPEPSKLWAMCLLAAAAAIFQAGCGGANTDDVGATEDTLAAASELARPPSEPDGACKDFYAPDAQLVSGKVTRPWPTTPKPERGVAVKEANWGTCEVRTTDHQADGLATFARNDYSRRQAFNADNTRQLVYALDGFWHLYNAKTYQHLGILKGLAGDSEPQWHHSNPDLMFYLPTNGVGMKLYQLDVTTNVTTTVADFSARLKARWPSANAAWTKSEGSPSANGRYWCFMVDSASWTGLGLFTWDRLTDQIIGTTDVTQRPDHVSMSPSGKACVASHYGGPGVVVYNRDLSASKKIAKIGEHSDIGLDANGDDVYVSVDYAANAGDVYMVNLRTGVRTDLFATYLQGTTTAMHFSGKAFNKPGWFLMSTYADSGGAQQWLHRKVFAVQMAASPIIYNLADTRTTSKQTDGYFSEPMASVSRDFTRVVWNSNWNASDANALDVDTYVVQIKPSMLP